MEETLIRVWELGGQVGKDVGKLFIISVVLKNPV